MLLVNLHLVLFGHVKVKWYQPTSTISLIIYKGYQHRFETRNIPLAHTYVCVFIRSKIDDTASYLKMDWFAANIRLIVAASALQ